VTHLQGPAATADPPSLSWDRAAGADGYRLYRDEKLVRSTKALTFSDSRAAVGVHVYHVTVIVDGAEGEPSNSVRVDYEPVFSVLRGLPAPTGLTQTAPNALAFVWQPVPGAAGYDVSRGRDHVKRVKGPAYEETDVLPDGTYDYTVRAVDSFGNAGPESDVLSLQHLG